MPGSPQRQICQMSGQKDGYWLAEVATQANAICSPFLQATIKCMRAVRRLTLNSRYL